MTDLQDLTFNAEAIGRWVPGQDFPVERERIIAYAEATNDPIAAHLAGDVAPPVFAIVPMFDSLVATTMEVVPYQLIPRVVHGEQHFRFHRPIRAGDVLSARSRVIGYTGKEKGTPGIVHAEVRDAAGELVNEQWVTFFFRGFNAGEAVGDSAPDHSFDEALRAQPPVATVTAHVDDDQTFRYSPAAGDPMPIHLDEDAAKSAGLPGIIAHGLCTMAFTSWAALTELAGSDTARLRELAVRFAKPVLPGQDITSSFWHRETVDGDAIYQYESTAAGDLVIKDGWARISD